MCTALAQESPAKTIATIRKGVPARTFDFVASLLGLPQSDLAKRLRLVHRTISRRRSANTRLSAEESEKVLRVMRIFELARTIIPDDAALAKWMLKPAAPLDDNAPIDLLDTDVGAAEVEGFIRGIAYGNIQ
jgi:putative toxin-antitoxin system antitoxin component (TIGR02293 family)